MKKDNIFYIIAFVIVLFIILSSYLNLNKVDEKYKMYGGYLTIGDEVGSFKICGSDEDSWIMGDSFTLENLKSNYEKMLNGKKPYTQLFVVLGGKIIEKPLDSFGVDYDNAFFVKDIIKILPNGNCKTNLIRVSSPIRNSNVASPLRITGITQGNWYSEGDFPVFLVDWDGKIIAKSYVTAQSDWMSGKFISFEGELEFEKPEYNNKGTLILMKDNVSDKYENNQVLEIPVLFN